MNVTELQEAVDATSDWGELFIPPGLHAIDITAGPIRCHRPIHIRGAGSSVSGLDVYPKDHVNDAHLFAWDCGDGADIRISDLTVYGPRTTKQDPLYDNGSAFSWQLSRTGNGTMSLERVIVGGQFSSAVIRAGGGLLSVNNCTLNGYEAPIKFFGSHGETGQLNVTRSTLSGHGSKTDSIGVYIHPQFNAAISSTLFSTFGRYGFYANGTPKATNEQSVSIDGCSFVDCDIAQFSPGTSPVVSHCSTSGWSGPGTVVGGHVTFVDCDLGSSPLEFTKGDHDVTLVDCRLRGDKVVMVVAGHGTFRFVDCEWALTGKGRAFTTKPGSDATILMSHCKIFDDAPKGGALVATQSPVTLDWGSTQIFTDRPSPHGLQMTGDPIVIGSPVILPRTVITT